MKTISPSWQFLNCRQICFIHVSQNREERKELGGLHASKERHSFSVAQLLYTDLREKCLTFVPCLSCFLSSSVLQEPKGSETGNYQLFETLLQAITQFFQQVRLVSMSASSLC